MTIFVRELTRWQARINLVGAATLPDLWRRHIADCGQLATLAEGASWLDLGSGAGLPGLVAAVLRPDVQMTLIESDGRKAAFLRHAAHAMSVTVTVLEDRIERAIGRVEPVHVVTARALAPLRDILAYAHHPLSRGAVGLFPKGARYPEELTAARESWTFDLDLIPSRTDPEARILRVTKLGRAAEVTC